VRLKFFCVGAGGDPDAPQKPVMGAME